MVPISVLLRVPTVLRQYYGVPIHIKSFGTKFRYLRMHLGAYERERDPGTLCHPCNSLKHNTQGKPKCSEVGLHSYGLHENTDRMAESIHKNGIYSIAQNAMEFVKFWMNKRRSVT